MYPLAGSIEVNSENLNRPLANSKQNSAELPIDERCIF